MIFIPWDSFRWYGVQWMLSLISNYVPEKKGRVIKNASDQTHINRNGRPEAGLFVWKHLVYLTNLIRKQTKICILIWKLKLCLPCSQVSVCKGLCCIQVSMLNYTKITQITQTKIQDAELKGCLYFNLFLTNNDNSIGSSETHCLQLSMVILRWIISA